MYGRRCQGWLADNQQRYDHSSRRVSTINHDVRARSVGRGIASEVDIGALELSCFSVSSHWNHAVPKILRLLRDEVAQACVDVSRRDGIDSRKASPLVRQRTGEVDATSFGNVVRGLLLGKVGFSPSAWLELIVGGEAYRYGHSWRRL